MPLAEVLAGLQQAEYLARLYHQHAAAAACATARELLTKPANTRSEQANHG